MKKAAIEKVDALYLRKEIPKFNTGDTVKVMQKVVEAGKTRTQAFEGVVIRKRGSGIQSCFTVRRISFGEGVEKTFPIHSPAMQSVTVTRQGKVRRARLYYLRHKSGKEGRIASGVASQRESGSSPA